MKAMLAPRNWKDEIAFGWDVGRYDKDHTAVTAYRCKPCGTVELISNDLIYMSPTGVHKVSNEERHSRIVMTDRQMVERGLEYDAIRGGLVKHDPKPVVSTGLYQGYELVDVPLPGKKGKVVKKDYNTIGVRFLRGETLHKVYTYKIRKGAKVHLGQELVAKTDRGDTVVVVVEIHKTPQDTLPGVVYKFIEQKVVPL
jgi:hypothetical protein